MAAQNMLWRMSPIVNIASPYGSAEFHAALRDLIDSMTDCWTVETDYDSGDAATGNLTVAKQVGVRNPDARIFFGTIRTGTTAPTDRGLYSATADLSSPDTNGYVWASCSPDCGTNYTAANWKTASPLNSGYHCGFKAFNKRAISSVPQSRMWAWYTEEVILLCLAPPTGDVNIGALLAGAKIEALEAYGAAGDVIYGVNGTVSGQLHASSHILTGGTEHNFYAGYGGGGYSGGAILLPDGVTRGLSSAHPYAGLTSSDHLIGRDSWTVPASGALIVEKLRVKDWNSAETPLLGWLRQIHPYSAAPCRSILLAADGVTHRGYMVNGHLSNSTPTALLYNPAA